MVRIETPGGHGTGFIVKPPPEGKLTTIATANHVIDHADIWRQPMNITHFPSGKQVFLDVNSRVVNRNVPRDMAIVQFSGEGHAFPEPTLPFVGASDRINEGAAIGWLGYPSIASMNLCFFYGHISAWLENDEAYLVDGVAIHGVSGGPSFILDINDQPIIVGLVTEYRPNMATGNALPGVSLVRAINPLLKFYAEMEENIKKAKVQDILRPVSQGGIPTGLQ